MNDKVELIIDAKSVLGEGPCWDHLRNLLYWVDIMGKKLHIYNPILEVNRTYEMDQYISAVVLRESGGLAIALQDGIYSWNEDNWKELLAYNPDSKVPLLNNRFNDGKCDPAGRFWIGTMDIDAQPCRGTLYCLDLDLTMKPMVMPVSISNGLAWSQDHKTMYFIDTATGQVAAYNYELETGNIHNKSVVVEIPEVDGVPDGMTIDAEGMLWIAHWGGFQVSRWDPYQSKCLQTISIPAPQVTSCTFGGEHLDELYITTASTGLDDELLKKYPHSGGVFRIKTEVKGLPTSMFKG